MKRLVYYKEGRRYYWVETDRNVYTITKQDFEAFGSNIKPLDTNLYVYEIILFFIFVVSTLLIIFNAH